LAQWNQIHKRTLASCELHCGHEIAIARDKHDIAFGETTVNQNRVIMHKKLAAKQAEGQSPLLYVARGQPSLYVDKGYSMRGLICKGQIEL
jgi:hypothetical protein